LLKKEQSQTTVPDEKKERCDNLEEKGKKMGAMYWFNAQT